MEFSFQQRWKEELVCSSSQGQFGLEITMGGARCVYLPTEASWKSRGPAWAVDHWESLHTQLTAWCEENGATLHLDERAMVYPVD
ncbi:MAG: hypothetical protein GY851_01780 [bacterium]|nr:hypothetical protein [bacterium]